jgi:hypothetical protein
MAGLQHYRYGGQLSVPYHGSNGLTANFLGSIPRTANLVSFGSAQYTRPIHGQGPDMADRWAQTEKRAKQGVDLRGFVMSRSRGQHDVGISSGVGLSAFCFAPACLLRTGALHALSCTPFIRQGDSGTEIGRHGVPESRSWCPPRRPRQPHGLPNA